MARHYGVPVAFVHYGTLIGISLSVVSSVKIAGIILVTAFLIIPAVSARLLARSLRSMISISVALGVVASVLGMFFSYILNMPPGPVIVVLLFIQFLSILSVKKLFGSKESD
jgi:zinc transport system permease protein